MVSVYRKLSKSVHEPAIKEGRGKYSIPIPADLATHEVCLLQKIATSGLKWNVNFFKEGEEEIPAALRE